ncbi:potassium channel family protein [Priestia megaterium]|uniref:potassium channel family protein n=1 Tax=Priestia megaterium TaxID=1404 RepID=UPI002363EC69|nr:potassium channel family protein [Priestia megaterium]MDD1514298.1 potassium channel family protein [Priestia megaterium]
MMEWLLFRLFRRSILVRLLFIIGCLVLLFGMLIHFLEPQTFGNVFEGIWWVIITISTIGYGDFAPTTTIGRVAAIILVLIGTGFITTYFVTLSKIAVSAESAYLEGNLKFYGKDHFIVVGWNERAKLVLESYRDAFHKEDIVLIDDSLTKNPMICDRVHFIKGSPSHYEVLELANARYAKKVLITADQHKTEEYADMNTIVTLVALQGLNPSIYSIVELLTKKHIQNAQNLGVNEMIKTNELISQVMYEHIFVKKLESLKKE